MLSRRALLILVGATCLACGRDGLGQPLDPSSTSSTVTTTAPQGDLVRVSSSAELQAAIGALVTGRTIELAPGVYRPPGEAFFLPESVDRVTIAGASGRREDVVVRGGRFGFWANAVSNLTVRDLTIEGAAEHGIVLNCAADSPVVRNVLLRNIGDQFIKANPGPGCGVDNGIVENSWFEYTEGAPDDYTNGVDVHFGVNWVIRGNTFRGFAMGSGELVGPAVLMWNGSANTVVENNRFEDNARDISLGLDALQTSRPPVNNASLSDHRGGRISGNVVTKRPGLRGADVAVAVFDSPGTRVETNTITMAGTYPNAIEYRFPRTTGVVITGNVTDAAIQAREGATATVSGNTTR